LTFEDARAVKAAWIGWALLFIMTATIIAAGSVRSVVPAYQLGADNWMAGRPLYDGTGVGGFVYLPQSAVLFVPFALLPPVLGEALWRLLNICIFAFGLRAFGGFVGGRTGVGLFPLMTLVSVPLVWDCARNGQATLAMAGCMLLAVVDTAEGRWWRASAWLALGVVVKPIILVLVLLAAAVEWRLGLRLLVALLAVALAPFLAQHPSYVADQYAGFVRNSAQAAHVGVTVQGWAHPFSALRAFGVVVPEGVQTAIRLTAAPCALAVCMLAWRRLDKHRAAFYLYSFAAAYLLLFSPRTENNTHMLLAPSIAFFFAEAVLLTHRTADGVIAGMAAAMMAAGRPIQRVAAPGREQVWFSPLLAALFTVYLLIRWRRDMKAAAAL
jgi:alpha-1,2-mannosyltransferase